MTLDRARIRAEAAEWLTYVSDRVVIVAGGAPKVVCPLCRDDHEVCRFATGSVHCVRTDCPNPHHRPSDLRVYQPK
jgi:hypothetical protein